MKGLRQAVTTATSLIALLAPVAAFAQQTDPATEDSAAAAPEAPPEDIVVTGIRGALQGAISQKRDADRVQEVLAAEDLGKLPEASIAESLARLPGISTNRDRGNGTQISIRGLGPNLVNTLLNGREIVSAESSRNIRYEQFPAELLNGASIYKSPTAAQVEGAIAGQVDLRTVKPLDYKGRSVSVNVRGIFSTEADRVQDADPFGYVASISYVGRISDTLGFAVGYSGRKQAVATTRTNIFRYAGSFTDFDGDGLGQNGLPITPDSPNNQGDGIPFGFEALARGGNDERHGAVGVLQWRPSSAFELNADFFYSRVSFDETQRGFRVENLPFGNVLSDPVVTNGYVTGITTTNAGTDFGQVVRGVNESFFFKDNLYAGGLNGRYEAGGWEVLGDVGYSTTDRRQQFLTLRTEPFGVTPTTRFQSFRGRAPIMTIDTDLTNPSLYRIADFQIPENGGGAPLINDELWSASFDVKRELGGFFKNIQFGGRYTDRSKDYTQRTQFGFIDPAQRVPVPADLLNPDFQFGGEYGSLPGALSIDIPAAFERFFGEVNPTESFFDQRFSWVVGEKTYAGYGQLNLDGELFGIPLLGNAGLRVIRTETISRSTEIDQTQQPDGSVIDVANPIAVRNQFTDWLPNLNLTFQPTDQLQLRLGFSKALSRAPLDDLNAGSGVFTFNGVPQGFGGNPLLEPFRATQYDATVEWYLNRDTAITLAGFYKDLDTFIVQQVTAVTVPDPAGGPALEGTFRQPVNGQGGSIKGFELSAQTVFSFLPSPFDGLGVFANYSYTDSSISVTENDNAIGSIPLPGLSKHVANLVAYYSKAGLEARVGYRYRSSYATELGDTDRILFTAPEGVLDMQISYEFPESTPLAGVQVMFQGNNLTNEPFETYYGDRNLQGRYEKFGTRYLFGIGFKL
ncbi:TonB-dependent receptor [Sphingomonas sanxanigenens]|uniref:TonB-denpendent receptor n=2 Tax=Sphingomonas sanxanigenens TaxID=397260 RepID=W0AGJ0_9SPHN|nr:TonB-dependent receptor [Sphingomonas sanxanigenens]AHA38090.1 glycosyltransferase [Sphingomonas sanxanigenens]AHE56236.1 hypothetical protein NX02_23100 [Sphingomonas sanxanigenens DSM 19645 = NX02]